MTYFINNAKMIKKVFSKLKISYADMAELADAHGSGPCESDFMQVQVLLSAPHRSKVRFTSTFYVKKASARFLASPLSQKVTLGSPVRL